MYVKVLKGVPYPYSIFDLRNDNPNTSFPDVMTDKALAAWDVFPCIEGAVPELGECEQAVRDKITMVDGVWVQNFTNGLWPADQASQYVREKRNALLAETDWMALSDVTMGATWAEYRQSLRDITSQVGFPYGIVWPAKPE